MVEQPSSVLESLPRELVARALPKRLARREYLHLAGEPCTRAHVLQRGVMKLTACDAEGRETILGLALPGELVGDAAVVDGSAHALDAIAVTDCDLLSFDRCAFLDVVVERPPASLALLRQMSSRYRWMSETARERTSAPVAARLAGRLLDLAALVGTNVGDAVEVKVPLVQGELGALAGTSRESASKVLRRMKQAGVIDYRRKRLRILRPNALERIRCAGRDAGPYP